MLKLIEAFKEYLYQNLGIKVSISNFEDASKLQFFLRDAYEIYKIKLIQHEFLVVIPTYSDEMSPSIIKKNFELIRNRLGMECIFLNSNLKFYERRRLIEYKIPFVVPGNQMYLPDLMIDLREHLKREKKRIEFLSPSSQAVLLYFLLKNGFEKLNQTETAKRLNYSIMTVKRAFDELESLNLGKISKDSRSSYFFFEQEKEIVLKRALKHMKSPVRKTIFLKNIPDELINIEAGVNALSHISMIESPKIRAFAISYEDWKRIRYKLNISKYQEDAKCILEVWKYSPCLVSNKTDVDRISLFLSLRDEDDERIQIAIEKCLNGVFDGWT